MSEVAQDEASVKSLYQDEKVAANYIQDRFALAWGRLLHETQIQTLNEVIRENGFDSVLELAPGPARLAPYIRGIRSGVMIEASGEMIEVARRRLLENKLDGIWEIRHGNAFDLSSLGRTFDFVFTFRFIRHFAKVERERLYREIARWLNPSGILVFDVVNKPTRVRLDAKVKERECTRLPVYDVSYTNTEFLDEIRESGFSVLSLLPVIRHFDIQAWISHKVGPRLPTLASTLVWWLEKLPAQNPLEWIAVCRKLQ